MDNIAAMANWKYARCPDCGASIYREQKNACCRKFAERLRERYVMRDRHPPVPLKVEGIFGIRLDRVFEVIKGTTYEPVFRSCMTFLRLSASQNISEVHRNTDLAKVMFGILNKYSFTDFNRHPEALIRHTLAKLEMSNLIDKWKECQQSSEGTSPSMRVKVSRAEQYRNEVLSNIRCDGVSIAEQAAIKPDYFFGLQPASIFAARINTGSVIQNTTEETQMKTTVLVLDANRGLALSTTNETARSVLNGLELVNITRDSNGDIAQLQRADVNILKSYVNLNIMDSEAELAARAEEVRETKLQNITTKLAKLDEERAELTKLLKEVKADK